MGKNSESTIKTLRKRVAQLKAQLNAEKDARDQHVIKVRNALDGIGLQLQAERQKYINLQVQYDDLLLKYEEETGVRLEAVQEQESISDEKGGEVGAAENVEKG